MDKKIVFSLDIGTRNVVGTIGYFEDDLYHIVDYEIVAHPERAMYDGQIHDIDKVARVIGRIKKKLEERNEISLQEVAIAAAGRALKTEKVTIERALDYTEIITKEQLDAFEMDGIQRAQANLEEDPKERLTKYYCVGYTVTKYFLDESMILNPKGHRGSKLSMEIIATFLPHIVVDSLYTAVDQVGLEVVNLTLEPIAAINVAIPENLRLLNIALVDVGAGTSDIAITRDGTIVSFAMVSLAGDEVTEQIARDYLLDFDMAEEVKIKLSTQDQVSFTNILGIPTTLTRDDFLEQVQPIVDEITSSIAKKILEFNQKAPSAVFCIGGGSQIPTFSKSLASHLQLPPERAVIKGVESLQKLSFHLDPLKGPEYITPVGIGYTAMKEQDQDFLQVVVNDKQIRLFNSKQMSVSDALVLIGYQARNLLPAKGEPITYYFNGIKRKVMGHAGEPAKIYLNGTNASLDSKIKHKDRIDIEPAVPGAPASLALRDLMPKEDQVKVNRRNLSLVKSILVNNKQMPLDYTIKEDDQIKVYYYDSIRELCNLLEMDHARKEFYKNGLEVDLDEDISPGDVIEISEKVEKKFYNYNLIVNGEQILINDYDHPMVYVDIFDHIDFDLSKPKGIIDLKLNGRRARYTDPLKTGDVIDIKWK